jgi:transposase-like protein
MQTLKGGFDDVTAVSASPKPYRKRLRITNRLEHLNQEIRRREWVIRILPNHSGMSRKRQKQVKTLQLLIGDFC